MHILPSRILAAICCLMLLVLTSCMRVTTGTKHSCAILSNGSVKCWGYNANGELGLGDTKTRGTEGKEMGSNLPVIDLGINTDNTKYTAYWLSAGDSHTCAILSDESLKCWGKNDKGQLGLGDQLSRGDASNEMGNYLPKVNLGVGKTAKYVSAGVSHTCAILNDDTLKCWGDNTSGKLGNGNEIALLAPSASIISFDNEHTVLAVSAGISHTCAILDDHSVRCWGNNASGQLGMGNSTPLNAPSASAVSLGIGRSAFQISSRGDYSCVILDDGSAKCWGNNSVGQLGQNDEKSTLPSIGTSPDQMGDNLPAIVIGTGRTAIEITTANYAGNTCVILDDRTVKCWGTNTYFQLGTGTIFNSNKGDDAGEIAGLSPVQLGTGLGVEQISFGAAHVCVVLGEYTIKCWGWGQSGQLGNGSGINRGSSLMGDDLPAANLSEPLALTATAATRTPTRSLTRTASLTKTITKTPTQSNTPTSTKTRTVTKTRTLSRTATATQTASNTRTLTKTRTSSNTRTLTKTRTSTRTRTATPTITPTH